MNDKVMLAPVIIEKIKVLPFNTETTIAELINYNPKENFVEPLTQGQISSKVDEICRKENICIERNDGELGGLAFYCKFKKVNLKESGNNVMNKEFKINNNIVFEDEETKIQLQKYLDEINEYNKKIQNGEESDINMGDLLDKYRETFYDEELENKLAEIDNKKKIFKSENNEMDELLNKINNKITQIDKNNR